MWTRQDDVHNGRFRPTSAHHVRAGFDSANKLVLWHHRIAVDRVKPFTDPLRYQASGGKDSIVMRGSDLRDYDVPNQLVQQLYRDTGVRTAPLRGIGYTANRFVTESFLDEIARQRGDDPIDFRLKLLRDSAPAKKVVERVAEMAGWRRPRTGRGLGCAYLDYSDTKIAGIAEISLDRDSGEITVHDFWCAIDCGIAVQPDNVLAQTEGSIVYGLGLALSETISIKKGVVQQSNFGNYHVPRLNEVPQMHIEVIASRRDPSGVGQMATPLVAPAIASAFAALTGVRLRHTPFTPDRVKEALA
jgi:isoquinoline 1-oxidoreductase beta subunit